MSNNEENRDNEAPPEVFGDPNDPEDPVLEENNLHLVCPVCDLHFQVTEFRNHMLYTHPEFVAIWASALFGPMFHEGEYLSFVREVLVESDDFPDIDIDNMSYEELVELCEQIGDHKEGVAVIDDVLEKVEVVEKDQKDTLQDIKCPICLEELATDEVHSIEKIKQCGHMFCSGCIRTWLKENKKCPLCKGDAS